MNRVISNHQGEELIAESVYIIELIKSINVIFSQQTVGPIIEAIHQGFKAQNQQAKFASICLINSLIYPEYHKNTAVDEFMIITTNQLLIFMNDQSGEIQYISSQALLQISAINPGNFFQGVNPMQLNMKFKKIFSEVQNSQTELQTHQVKQCCNILANVIQILTQDELAQSA